MQQVKCEGCDQRTPSYDIIHYGSMERGYRQLCTRCYNAEVAASCALDDFEHAQFEPVMLLDVDGNEHVFHFRTRLFGDGVAIDGFEVHDGVPAGYQFCVVGLPDAELLSLLAQLFERMRRALRRKHLQRTDMGLEIAHDQDVVRGRIEWDEAHDGRIPMLVIDGRDVSWQAFGRLLMTYEGFQFKLEIHDRSDEV